MEDPDKAVRVNVQLDLKRHHAAFFWNYVSRSFKTKAIATVHFSGILEAEDIV